MEMKTGLRPHGIPRLMKRVIADCCVDSKELRLLLQQDQAFQHELLSGRAPLWTFQKWHPADPRFRKQRLSWLLTVLLTRHVGIGYSLMGFSIMAILWPVCRLIHLARRS